MSGSEKQPENPQNTGGGMVYHYSRERRLSRASEDVQAINEGKTARPSIFKTLFSNRSNRFVLIAILIFTAFGFSTRFTGGERQQHAVRLGGNILVMTIFPLEDTLFLGILKSAPETGELYTGAVEITVSPAGAKTETEEAPPVFAHRIYFNPVESESYQISIPFEGTDFFVALKAGEEQKTMRLRVSGN